MSMTKRVVLGLAVATLLTAVAAAPAVADTTGSASNQTATNLVVNAGALGFQDTLGNPAMGNFADVTLNGSPQVTSANLAPFVVEDSTGTAAGWHVTFAVDQDLTNGAHPALPSIVTTAPVVTPDPGSDGTGVAATNLSGANQAITTSAWTAATATVGNGMGSYLVSPRPFVVTVPANAFVGTYTANFTVAIVSGP
jgi:hypothetical protein